MERVNFNREMYCGIWTNSGEIDLEEMNFSAGEWIGVFVQMWEGEIDPEGIDFFARKMDWGDSFQMFGK